MPTADKEKPDNESAHQERPNHEQHQKENQTMSFLIAWNKPTSTSANTSKG